MDHYINLEGVIPNSKLVILPSAREGEMWRRELFLRPGEWIPWVTAAVIGGTLVLAIIVFVLHLNEKVRITIIQFVALFLLFFRGKTSRRGGGYLIISTLMLCKMTCIIRTALVDR